MGLINWIKRSNDSDLWRQALSDFITGKDLEVPKYYAEISESTAMSITAVWSSIRLIAWTIASLPLFYFERMIPRGKRRIYDSFYRMMHDSPNSEMTSFRWRELMAIHQNLWGVGISEIKFVNGEPKELWPLPPWRMRVLRDTANSTTIYQLQLDSGVRNYMPYELLIFPSLSANMYTWQSPISTHRMTLSAAAAVKDFGYKTFSQGTNPAGILSGYKVGKNDTDESLSRKFKLQYEGLSNSHKLMLLEEGLKFERVGLPPEDAQYLETRQFDISEIARIYNVPLHLLQSHEKATTWGSGLEELNASFLTYTIRPYLVQWEQEINKKLVYDKDCFVEFNFDGLLRGRMLDRYQAYDIGRRGGWLSANDIREKENDNPIPNGDSYLIPSNMQVVGEQTGKSGVIDSKEFIDELKSILSPIEKEK